MGDVQCAMLVVAAISVIVLYWIYDGYGRLLGVLGFFISREPPSRHDVESLPSTAVVLTVHDEVELVRDRILNLLESSYPPGRLAIVVASDRSTDGTDEIVGDLAKEHPEVRLFASPDSSGKSDAQNKALKSVDEEIVVFTDAGTMFDPGCVCAMNERFADPNVGMVDAELSFTQDGSSVGAAQGWYWSYERKLRRLESRVGMLAVGSGACMAVRRELLDSLQEGVGEDCQVPLMVVSKGRRVVQEPLAFASDSMPSNVESEMQARARMTARNLVGTFSYPALLNPFRRPGIAFGIWSHKILRWSSPCWLLVLLTSTSITSTFGGLWILSGAIPAGILIAGIIGWVGGYMGRRIPLADQVWAFLVANAGFACGITLALSGRTKTRYSNR